MIYKFAACFPRKPAAYLCLLITWAITLWILSSGNPGPKGGLEIPHLDKVCHFIYFAAGGFLYAFFAGLKWPKLSRLKLLISSTAICSIIGRLDEYHQSFTPGRFGNDTGDWLADTLGGAAGAAFGIYILLPHLLTHIESHSKAGGKEN